MSNDKILFYFNIVITVLMFIGLILLIVGCSINNKYLIFCSLGGVAFVYLFIALPLRIFFDE